MDNIDFDKLRSDKINRINELNTHKSKLISDIKTIEEEILLLTGELRLIMELDKPVESKEI